MTKKYNCQRCGYATSVKIAFSKHLNRKYNCKPKLKNIPIEIVREAFSRYVADNTKTRDVVMTDVSTEECRGYIYLLREREFIKTNEPIFKVGKTTQELQERISKYPKHSELLFAVKVKDCHNSEKTILKKMRKVFVSRRDIGNEYFEGDETEIKRFLLQSVE